MKFIADLHIHSKYSRATAKNLDLENIYIASQIKGIKITGTGDFTHPEWFEEIKEKLEDAEPGLFKLKKNFSQKCDLKVPISCRNKVRFILQTEISSIYKKNKKVRKNHNLVFFKDFKSVEKFNLKLDKIGNIKSDGRPILGLDARDLLEIVLETSDNGYLIPAHIWTPWFSMLGSKSGFETVDECFEDLTGYIFAAETGLSSDPAMNWRVSDLDNLTLISNSDAHSPRNLGREANIFDTDLSYGAIFSALKSGDKKKFLGTYEFFPEEGKYHLDGHRNCGIQFFPKETLNNKGICPVCGKKLTLGVLYRVEELADREKGIMPERGNPYYSIVPLADILSDIFRRGPQTKTVGGKYEKIIETLGPEFEILQTLPIENIEKAGIPLLGEAIKRMRSNILKIDPGFDGEYGKVKIFNNDEREKLMGQRCLFDMSKNSRVLKTPKIKNCKEPEKKKKKQITAKHISCISEELNHWQQKAVESKSRHLLIVAGPGTGKTRTLTQRILFLIDKKNISPEHILALTFTRKAASEMLTRLKRTLKPSAGLPRVDTFHGLCVKILKEIEKTPFSIVDDNERLVLIKEAVENVKKNGEKCNITPLKMLQKISSAKQHIDGKSSDIHVSEENFCKKVYKEYQEFLSILGMYDFDDLIVKVVRILEKNASIRSLYKNRFKYIFVDEYQDLNQGQYKLLKLFAASGVTRESDSIVESNDVCVIGDPDQSIYGFRGSDVIYFHNFTKDYPDAEVINLTRNYRSTETILAASYHVIKNHRIIEGQAVMYSDIAGIRTVTILESASEKAEAVAIGKKIEKLIGGIGFHSMDFGNIDNEIKNEDYSFSDFAVLFRTVAQGEIFKEVLESAGIPCQIASRENMFMKKGVAEIISYLKIIESAGSIIDFERVIDFAKPGIGHKTLHIFKNWCYRNRFNLDRAMYNAVRLPIDGLTTAKQLKINDFIKTILKIKTASESFTVEEKLDFIIKKTGIDATIESDGESKDIVNRIKVNSRQYGKDTVYFLCDIALQTDSESYDEKAEKVSLMTMHAAKGLEFPVVFIAGCEDGFIPFKKNEETNDIEEERRLFYVAMTRAKEKLYLSHVVKRRIYGKSVIRHLSPFIKDIKPYLIEYEKRSCKNKKRPIQLELF